MLVDDCKLWFEREVLFPLQRGKERFSGKPDGA
jgi:hypothetical protein